MQHFVVIIITIIIINELIVVARSQKTARTAHVIRSSIHVSCIIVCLD